MACTHDSLVEQLLKVIQEKGDDSVVLFAHNRSMLVRVHIILILLFWAVTSPAKNLQREFIEQFQSSRIWFPTDDSPLVANAPGRYPEPLNFIFSNILSWTPTGEGRAMTEACDPETWHKRMHDPRVRVSANLQGGLISKYFQDCRNEVETGDNGYLSNIVQMMSMKYQAPFHPFMRRAIINLPGNIKLKGMLALKGDFKRRPLVIIRTGIFSSVEDFKPERAWMMMLFEQSPFNVLILENMSSSDFVANNTRFAFGGYDEGIQNLLIAQLLTQSSEPLSQIIDSIHVFGISLGGHGVLFSSLLNKHNSIRQPLIRSFMALCPVVDLSNTMVNLTQSGVKSAVVDLWSQERLKGLYSKIPGLVNFGSFEFLSTAIAEIARRYQGGLSYISSVKLPPGMKDGPEFWKLNDFWGFYQDVQEPVLIIATEQDPAVPYNLNSQRLLNKELKVASKNIRVVELPQGHHCTLPISYDWKMLATLFQSYILSHAPSFKMAERVLDMDITEEGGTEFSKDGLKISFKVQPPQKKASFVKLDLTLQNQSKQEKEMALSLPLSEFDFRFFNEELTVSEQEMLVRWLNHNLRMKIVNDGRKITLRTSWLVAK